MTKILITNCHLAHLLGEANLGCAAVMISTVKILREFIADVEFSTVCQLSERFAEQLDIKVVKNKLFSTKPFSPGTVLNSTSNLVRCAIWAVLNKCFRLSVNALINNRELTEYANADVVVDISMDHYSDDFGIISVVEHSKDILLSVLLQKPVVIWAQSLGPFRSRLTSWIVRFTLNRVSLITVREDISRVHLRELGVNVPPIYITADPAFLLEPTTGKRVKNILHQVGINEGDRPLIGMTISWTILIGKARSSGYLQFMKSMYKVIRDLLPERLFKFATEKASHFRRLDMLSYIDVEVLSQTVDYLVEKLNATVVLIPHDAILDDKIVAKEIFQRAKHRNRVKVISYDYSAQEVKGLIGQCDLFIGGKMHANIAALSSYVPTVGLQYSHKFYGIMKLLGQEEYVCDKLTLPDLLSKIDKVWANREEIRVELEIKMDVAKKRALYNGKLVSDLLKSLRAS